MMEARKGGNTLKRRRRWHSDGSSTGTDVEAVAGKEETDVETAQEERKKRWADCAGPGEEECYCAGKQQIKSLRMR